MKVIRETDLEEYLSHKIKDVSLTLDSPIKFCVIAVLAIISGELNSKKFNIQEKEMKK